MIIGVLEDMKQCKQVTKFYVDGGRGDKEVKAIIRCCREPHTDDQHISVIADSKPQTTVIWRTS